MDLVGQAQYWIATLLTVAAFGVELWAVIDCARRRPDAFVAADKRTKGFWLAVTGVCALIGFVFLSQLGNMLGLLAIVGAGVYLADVRPALDRVMGRGGRRDGPYGPW